MPTKKSAKKRAARRPVTSTPPGLTPCLWFDKNALEAAEYYVSVFPRSRITKVHRSPADNPGTKKGEVLLVEFKLDGKPFQALNGGPYFRLSEAVSFIVDCKDQAEMDRYYDALSAVPEAEQCGWVKDRFGLSWQLTPRALVRLLNSRDAAKAERAMKAMLEMKRLDVAALEAAARAPKARKVRSAGSSRRTAG
ncbi:MAG TPA: VOC family protein [Candidatus Thermoplasmatota archaeon]|nr:VOC family protein [Candidatus Thermoplasmatota archaeon]